MNFKPRNEKIAQDLEDGMRRAVVAKKHGITPSRVSQIMAVYRRRTQKTPAKIPALGPKLEATSLDQDIGKLRDAVAFIEKMVDGMEETITNIRAKL